MILRCVKTAVVLICFAISTVAAAMDYSVYSHQELLKLKDAVATAPEAEQEAYRQEWQRRLQNMNEEEKNYYVKALQSGDNGKSDDGKVPFVIQGRGYDKGEGTVIFGGGSVKPSRKGGNR